MLSRINQWKNYVNNPQSFDEKVIEYNKKSKSEYQIEDPFPFHPLVLFLKHNSKLTTKQKRFIGFLALGLPVQHLQEAIIADYREEGESSVISQFLCQNTSITVDSDTGKTVVRNSRGAIDINIYITTLVSRIDNLQEEIAEEITEETVKEAGENNKRVIEELCDKIEKLPSLHDLADILLYFNKEIDNINEITVALRRKIQEKYDKIALPQTSANTREVVEAQNIEYHNGQLQDIIITPLHNTVKALKKGQSSSALITLLENLIADSKRNFKKVEIKAEPTEQKTPPSNNINNNFIMYSLLLLGVAAIVGIALYRQFHISEVAINAIDTRVDAVRNIIR